MLGDIVLLVAMLLTFLVEARRSKKAGNEQWSTFMWVFAIIILGHLTVMFNTYT